MVFPVIEINGERQFVELNEVGGTGFYYFYINYIISESEIKRFFIGSVSMMKDGWTVNFKNNTWLTMDEGDIFIEMILNGDV